MYKLLIADASEPFTDALKTVFQNEFTLRICHDGETALEELVSFQPEVLVLNLNLPYKDGLTVLQQSVHRPQVILAITSYLSSYVEQTSAALGVQYLMIMPTVNSLRVRLMDLVKTMTLPGQDLSAQAAVHLHALGFHTHLNGYRQLCVGLPMFAQNPGMSLSKELYPAIAARFSLPDGRTVEHSVRKAIEAAWKYKNNAVWVKYFPPGPDGRIPCPTNKAFLSRLAELLDGAAIRENE